MKPNNLYLFFILCLLFSVDPFAEDQNDEIQRSDFPDGFFFGTATSAYQIEGAYLDDGKSLSNWDVFSHIQGKIKNGGNGDICTDHYHRYLEDIDIMSSLGVNSYRFSISWARVLPKGRLGEVNPAGITFYNNIIDNLLLKGIEPFVTIHHQDYPQELEDKYGAWLSPLMQEDFVHFTKICFERFGDRVKYWITINEPNYLANSAYMFGNFPPAHCSPPFGNCSVGNSDVEPLIAVHNMLLAHAKAAKLYREHFQSTQGGSIGIAVSAVMYEPFSDDGIGQEAASRALSFDLDWNLYPLIFGDYPPEMRHYHGNELPRFSPEETNFIRGSIDFIGVNQYTTLYAKDCLHSTCSQGGDHAVRGFITITGYKHGVPIGEPIGREYFFVVPRGMEEVLDYLKKRYNNIPMFITENGYATIKQNVPEQNLLHDCKRIEFHKAYLASLASAIRNGADVRGYFVWSLMDNFEWDQGYDLKYGLYSIDPQTLDRIPKISAKWYKNFLTNINLQNEATTHGNLLKNNNTIVSELREGKEEIE